MKFDFQELALSVLLAAGLSVSATAFWLKRDAAVVNAYAKYYHKHPEHTVDSTFWMGTKTQKCPLDLWIYQEIMHEVKPDVIVETGTYMGGSALYLASVFDLMNHGRVLTVDIAEFPNRPAHPRIKYLLGSSTGAEVLQEIKASIHPGERVLVALDSDHSTAHVLKELRLYSDLVSIGSYVIVEDTELNGHPLPSPQSGPWEAVDEFLRVDSRFAPDRGREKFGMTFNPRGYLKRIR